MISQCFRRGHLHDIQKENCLRHYSVFSHDVRDLAFKLYRQPLGPALELPTSTQPSPTLTTFPMEELALDSTATETQPTATQTAAPQPLCGGPAVMNILAIGSDARGQHYLYGLADIIRLVRVDFVDARVTILEVPRDLWVDIPEISDHYGITQGKLNQAYLYGNKGLGYYDGPGEGPGLLARTLNLNFGAQPDHYIAVNMRTFEAVVDAIGGIDIYLPYEISVKSKENPKGFAIPEGNITLTARPRSGSRASASITPSAAPKTRTSSCARLRKKLLSPAVVPAIPELVRSFRQLCANRLQPGADQPARLSRHTNERDRCGLRQFPDGTVQSQEDIRPATWDDHYHRRCRFRCFSRLH